MEVLATLRASTCDSVAFVSETVVATATAKKVYFLSAAASSADGGDAKSASSQGAPLGIAIPPRTAAFAAVATQQGEGRVLLSSADRPRQLEMHGEEGCIGSDALLSEDAPGDIQQVDVSASVVVVRTAPPAEDEQASSSASGNVSLYRLDLDNLTKKRSLRHLGTASVATTATSSSQAPHREWLVSVSPSTAGVQEALVMAIDAVNKPGQACVAHMTIVDVSGTIASQRVSAATLLPTAPTTDSEEGPLAIAAGATNVAAWTVDWCHRTVHVVLRSAPQVQYTYALAGLQRTKEWTPLAQRSCDDIAAIRDVCACGSDVWAAVALTNGRTVLRKRCPVESADTAADVVLSEAPSSSSEALIPRLAASGATTLVVLRGKVLLRYNVPTNAVASSSSAAGTATNNTNSNHAVAALPTAADALMRSALANRQRSGGQDKAAAWVEYILLTAGNNSKSQQRTRPTPVLRDSDYVAVGANGARPVHCILDALLDRSLTRAAGTAAASRTPTPVQQDKASSVVLAYLAECGHSAVDVTTWLRAFVAIGSPALQLAVWSLSSGRMDHNAMERMVHDHASRLRREALSEPQAVALFNATHAATLAVFASNSMDCLPFAAALCEALVLVHGATLVMDDGVRSKWATLAGLLADFSEWSLEWAAPSLGQITAHCGAPFTASKEAQFIEHQARRIRTTKEADIQTTTIVLEAPSVTRAKKLRM